MTKHGLLDAQTDPERVAAWWQRWPEANIGLRTGIAFDVLDLDGPEAAALVAREYGYKHTGPVSSTGKGFHLLFAVTAAKNGAGLLPKVDFRGTNGYIVAPPSIHPNGHRYAWIPQLGPDRPLPDAPEWLEALLFPPAPPPKHVKPSNWATNLPMPDLASELTALGCHLQRKAGRLVTNCPFHADDTPSLTVYPNETFYCFGCQAWGDALNVRLFRREGRLR